MNKKFKKTIVKTDGKAWVQLPNDFTTVIYTVVGEDETKNVPPGGDDDDGG